MSAIVVLTSDIYLIPFTTGAKFEFNGAALSSAAFGEALPYIGSYGVAIATVFFSLSTILGWAYYGEVCASYLFKNHSKIAGMFYRLVYVAFVFIGAIANIDIVWLVADFFNALMAVPNLVALIGLSGVVVAATKAHFANKNKLK
jgi:AGCS family alanine or glycine:cation symporter